MKASELQIGDWLYYKGQYNAFPFKVEQITKKKVGYHVLPHENRLYYLHLSEVQPIPLTKKILEKNGFIEQLNGSWMLENTHGFILSKNMYIYIGELSLKIEFVHELQHLLKLIGNYKEIIL